MTPYIVVLIGICICEVIAVNLIGKHKRNCTAMLHGLERYSAMLGSEEGDNNQINQEVEEGTSLSDLKVGPPPRFQAEKNRKG